MKVSYLLLLYRRKLISRRRFLMLLSLRREHRLQDDWISFDFDLSHYTERECWRYFRFLPQEIEELRVALMIPDLITTREDDHVSGIEALCILLRRLVYPSRWIDLRAFFGRSESSMCRVFLRILNHIDDHFRWAVEDWNQSWLQEADFYDFEDVIEATGGVLRGCFAFLDGTARPIARPKYFQRECFSGHKRQHCTRWQTFVLPNGMICGLYGGHRGSMHDSLLLTTSNAVATISEKTAGFAAPHAFLVYSDSGYGRGEIIRKPFSKAEVMADQRKKRLNKAMSSVREAVEWGFKDVISRFGFLDYKKQMRLYVSPINRMYRVAVILTNCHNCLHHNQTSQYFGLPPPSLEVYLTRNV